MATVAEVLNKLAEQAHPDNLPGMARFGVTIENRLGLSVPAMREMAKEIGCNHRLARALWRTGIVEARIIASMIDDPALATRQQAEQWVRTFNSWDVCDQVCQNLFRQTPWAWQKVVEWAGREEEYVKRAGFALLACLAWHEKRATDEQFVRLFPLLKQAATDERPYVKKAVNWALRNIGKRNRRLNRSGIRAAREIQRLDTPAARWIAADALRELKSSAVQQRLRKRT